MYYLEYAPRSNSETPGFPSVVTNFAKTALDVADQKESKIVARL